MVNFDCCIINLLISTYTFIWLITLRYYVCTWHMRRRWIVCDPYILFSNFLFWLLYTRIKKNLIMDKSKNLNCLQKWERVGFFLFKWLKWLKISFFLDIYVNILNWFVNVPFTFWFIVAFNKHFLKIFTSLLCSYFLFG